MVAKLQDLQKRLCSHVLARNDDNSGACWVYTLKQQSDDDSIGNKNVMI